MTTVTTELETLAIGTVVFLLAGCALPQHHSLEEEYGAGPTHVRDEMKQCVDQGSGCTLLLVDNLNFSDAVVYLNGKRIAEVAALKKSDPVFIANSQLANGRCIKLEVQLRDFFRHIWDSGTECITPGGHFGLSISDPFSTTILTSWS